MVGGSAGTPDLTGDLLALGMTALMALMMVITRRHPDRPMTLAVGPVSCLQLVAMAWVMGAQLDVTPRELVLLAGFGVVHATATVLLAEGLLRIRAAEAALIGALEVPLAPVWSWLILAEVPRMPTVAGGAVVLATLAWYLGRETAPRPDGTPVRAGVPQLRQVRKDHQAAWLRPTRACGGSAAGGAPGSRAETWRTIGLQVFGCLRTGCDRGP